MACERGIELKRVNLYCLLFRTLFACWCGCCYIADALSSSIFIYYFISFLTCLFLLFILSFFIICSIQKPYCFVFFFLLPFLFLHVEFHIYFCAYVPNSPKKKKRWIKKKKKICFEVLFISISFFFSSPGLKQQQLCTLNGCNL